jgi:hypothetical protein
MLASSRENIQIPNATKADAPSSSSKIFVLLSAIIVSSLESILRVRVNELLVGALRMLSVHGDDKGLNSYPGGERE